MRKYYFLFFFALIFHQAYSQQDAQYTQFMFNKLVYNPGYAGSAGHPSMTAVHRKQWVKIAGAPVSQGISFHLPFQNNRVGAGISINHDRIGPTQSTFLAMSYAYRIKVDQGTFSIGLQGAVRHYRVKWDEIQATHDGDNLIVDSENSKILPNAGIGLYYETEKFYVGLSAPHIIQGDISLLRTATSSDIQAIEKVHAYLMTGYIFPINDDVKFKPAFLIKYVKNAPLDLDINGSFLFMNKFWLGLSYRLGGSTRESFGESIDIIAQYQVTSNFRFGAAYDITLSEIKNYNRGSYELLLQYDIQKDNSRYTNPRFF